MLMNLFKKLVDTLNPEDSKINCVVLDELEVPLPTPVAMETYPVFSIPPASPILKKRGC